MSKKTFDDFFRSVKPLKNRTRVVDDTPPVATPRTVHPSTPAPLENNNEEPNTPVFRGSVVVLEQPDKKITRKIQTGKITIDAKLDLHGYSFQKAQESVTQTVEKSIRARHRWLLIITGKGVDYSGVLRKNLPLWLAHPRLIRHIISVMPAHQNDGGLGAFYVQLRTTKPSHF